MSRPDIPAAKRAGLELDLDAVCAAGPGALGPDDHYRLKTYGVCAQRQDDLFMVRLRVPGGRLDRVQLSTVVEVADSFGGGWVHLTTRQNIELHGVELGDVPAIRRLLEPVGLFGRSACGHTIRNVMACPDAATSPEEPFDVVPDARWLSDELVRRSRELNVALPNRVNIVLGGCTDCGYEALFNDIGLVATVGTDGTPGYQLWAGGSLGSAPRPALMLRPFLGRGDALAAALTLIEWFCDAGDAERLARSRLKFLIEDMGELAFRTAFEDRFRARKSTVDTHDLPPVTLPEPRPLDHALARAPVLGWRAGIRPEREPGLASITVRAPLGDLLAGDVAALARLAPTGHLVLTRHQNVVIPGVPVAGVPSLLAALADRGLGPDGARGAVDVRACPGLAFCSLAITNSQPVALAVEAALAARPDLPADLTTAVSGCPNSCARHQTADVGLSGTKVRGDGAVTLGYVLHLGADLPRGMPGEPVFRLTEREAPDAVVSVAEVWLALRRPGETPGRTFRRVGLDVVGSTIELRLRHYGWGDRPEEAEATSEATDPAAVEVST